MSATAGKCRWCGCTDVHACPGGCAWVDSACTICSACATVDVAWRDEPRRPPNMRRAFFGGFLAGAKDTRCEVDQNPYPRGAAQRGSWSRGFAAGGLTAGGLR